MRQLYKILLLLLLPLMADATHYMGGEITWECLPNGRYRFKMRVYRECYYGVGQAATFGQTTTIQSTGGGLASIAMTRVHLIDMSPICNPDPTFPRIICPGMVNSAPNLGALQENYYTSDANYPNGVLLNGIPPPTGWTFSWWGCCRNPSSNITNSMNLNWYLRAKMYPYNNLNANPCYDNSPAFAEVPFTATCVGYPFSYNHLGYDAELDSLAFEWGQPMISATQAITTYAPGYSYMSPLPGPVQNPNNSTPTLNPHNGVINIKSFTNGAFVTSVKVTSYRNGIKLSETWRDIQFVLSACGAVTPPTISINGIPAYNPFTQSTTIMDTVLAGEKYCSFIGGVDFGTHPNSQPQILTLTANSPQFGSGFTDTAAGCLYPPCATLSPPPPVTSVLAVGSFFCWQTTCDHLYTNNGIPGYSSSHFFNFTFKDDRCPIPEVQSATLHLVVMNPALADTPSISCVEVLANGNVRLDFGSKYPNAFMNYLIYYQNVVNGPWMQITSLSGVNNSFTHTGINAHTGYHAYRIRSVFNCKGIITQSPLSNISRTILLNASANSSGKPVLSWNSTNATSIGLKYFIFRAVGQGSFTLRDSTLSTTYLDTDTFCYDTLRYFISTDTTNCASISSIRQLIVNNTPYVKINPVKTVYCDYEPPYLISLTPAGGTLTGQGIFGTTFYPQLCDTGLMMLRYTFTNPLGCNAKDSVVFNIRPEPIVKILGLDTAYCGNAPNVVVTGSPPGGSFNWPVQGGIFSPSSLLPGTYNIGYFYTDAYGCNSMDSMDVKVRPYDQISVSGIPALVCSNSPPIILNAVPSGGTFTGTGISAGFFLPITAGAGLHPIKYSYTNAVGCVTDTNFAILVHPAPAVVLSAAMYVVCENADTFSLTGAPTGGIYSGFGLAGNVFNPKFTGPGLFKLFYEYTGTNGCTSRAETDILVNPKPQVDAGPDTSKACLDSAVVIGGPWQIGVVYNWHPAAGLSSVLQTNPQASPNITTKYRLTGLNQFGCRDTSWAFVIISDAPQINIGPDTILCLGQSIQLDAGPTPVSYEWSSGDVSRFITASPVSDSVFMVTISDGQCLNADTILLSVVAPYVMLGNDTTLCTGDTLWLDAGENQGYFWHNGDTTRMFAVTNPLPSYHTYSVIVNKKHCTASDSINIWFSRPDLNIGPDTSVCQGQLFYIDLGYGYTSYHWFDSTTNWYWIADTAMATGTYDVWLQVTNMLGCKNSDSLKLEVKYCPPPPYNPDDWKLSVYPNPAKGRFVVEIIGGHPELEVSLQDVFGRILRKFTIEAASGSSAAWLEMPGMAAGSYIITVSSEKRSEVQKILLHSR